MKKSFKSMLAVAALSASALISQAQQAPKILVLDMGKAFQAYYKTADMYEGLKAEQTKAGQSVEAQSKELNDLVAKYNDLGEQAKNPAITNEAKAKLAADGEKLGQSIQQKEADRQNYVMKLRRDFAEREQNIQGVLIEDISKKASELAKKKGADLVVPKGAVVYSNPSYEFTDEVIAEINKDKPAGSAATSAATPAAPAAKPAPAPAAEGAPTIVFPGAKK